MEIYEVDKVSELIRKYAYIDKILLKEIKLKIICKDIKISLSELGRRVWEFYLKEDFKLKGYKNMIKNKTRIKNVVADDSKIQILTDKKLSNLIDLKLSLLYKENYFDDQYYSMTWVTNELIQRVFINEEFGEIIK